MTEADWDILLDRIADGRCTPFLGSGAAAHVLPTGPTIAKGWAKDHAYPLEHGGGDLARVAQFLAVSKNDYMFPKELVERELSPLGPPEFSARGEPHGVLADLPLPLYITTNYDDFMTKALAHAKKEPVSEFCRWNDSPALEAVKNLFDPLEPGFTPSPATPLVFHMHGRFGHPESLVLTEDDYLAFLVSISRDQRSVIPLLVQAALASTSLLFIGYSLNDWDFRVLHRGLVTQAEPTLRRLSVTVQLPSDDASQRYLAQYFGRIDARVFWGTAEQFASELWTRWQAR